MDCSQNYFPGRVYEVGAIRNEDGGDIKWLRGSLVTLYHVRTHKDPGKPNDRLNTGKFNREKCKLSDLTTEEQGGACEKDNRILVDYRINRIQMRERVTYKTSFFTIQVLKSSRQNRTSWCGTCHKFCVIVFTFECPKRFRYGRRIRRVLGLRGQMGPGQVRGEHTFTREKKKPPLIKTDTDSHVWWGGIVSKCSRRGLSVIIWMNVSKDFHRL